MPATADLKGETTGEGETDNLSKYAIYRDMLAQWFDEPPEEAVKKVDAFELAVKKKFIDEPGQMKLLIVVDKLLTGFDAPPATFLYIDKQMRDHGLFQAICRVNRLDGDDKESVVGGGSAWNTSLPSASRTYTPSSTRSHDGREPTPPRGRA